MEGIRKKFLNEESLTPKDEYGIYLFICGCYLLII